MRKTVEYLHPVITRLDNPVCELVIKPEDLVNIVFPNTKLELLCAKTNEKPEIFIDSYSTEMRIGRWFRYKLRNRELDGPGWRKTRLDDWPVSGSRDKVKEGNAVEESTYWLDPTQPLEIRYPAKISRFIVNPFEQLPFVFPDVKILKEWNETWEEVVRDNEVPPPGHYAFGHIVGLRRSILERSQKVLSVKGFNFITAIPTWFHTAGLYKHLGFSFTYKEDQIQFNKLQQSLVGYGRTMSSWIVMRQYWAELAEANGITPEDYIKTSKIIRDENSRIVTYPLNLERNLWVEKKI